MWPEVVRRARDQKARLLFGDEASFPQWGTLTYTWARRGHQPVVKTSGKRKGWKVFGLLDYFTGRFFHQGLEGRFTSASYTGWALAQDERRRIFEESSEHVKTGLRYLPAVARRLHHCRDLGESEPFDFLTWFEYAPSYTPAFDELVAELRASEEWSYVDREIDIRVVRDEA